MTIVVLEGQDELERTLKAMLVRFGDLRPIWNLYKEAFYQAEADYFASEGNRTWPKNQPAYARWKARKYGSRSVMVMTGTLKDSLTSESTEFSKYKPERTFMEIGTKDPVGNILYKKRKALDANSPQMRQGFDDALKDSGEQFAQVWAGHSFGGTA